MSFMRHKVYFLALVLLLFTSACAVPAAPAPAAATDEPAAAATEAPAEEAAEEEATEEVAEEATAEATEEASEEAAAGDLPVVGFMKIVSHPALDAEQQGVKDALAEAGYIEGETVIFLEGNAEGDIATLTTIAQQFVDEGVDLIVATSTPALQAAYNVTQDFEAPPIVFNAVTSNDVDQPGMPSARSL